MLSAYKYAQAADPICQQVIQLSREVAREEDSAKTFALILESL